MLLQKDSISDVCIGEMIRNARVRLEDVSMFEPYESHMHIYMRKNRMTCDQFSNFLKTILDAEAFSTGRLNHD